MKPKEETRIGRSHTERNMNRVRLGARGRHTAEEMTAESMSEKS